MNHGAAMRHGKARLCRAECPPHFLFVLPKRKRAGHGTKEKALRDELPGKAVNSPKTGAGRHELPTELETPLPAALYLNLKSVRSRICGHGAQRGANRTSPAPLSAAAPSPCPGRGFQRGGTLPSSPVPLGGGFQRRGVPPSFVLRPLGGWFPKAGAEAPGLCVVSRGCGGKSKSPRVSL